MSFDDIKSGNCIFTRPWSTINFIWVCNSLNQHRYIWACCFIPDQNLCKYKHKQQNSWDFYDYRLNLGLSLDSRSDDQVQKNQNWLFGGMKYSFHFNEFGLLKGNMDLASNFVPGNFGKGFDISFAFSGITAFVLWLINGEWRFKPRFGFKVIVAPSVMVPVFHGHHLIFQNVTKGRF